MIDNKKIENLLQQIKFNENGLVPVITQDEDTKTVLMLAWADKENILNTINTGLAHYFSRSRGQKWLKGETSGHYQHVVKVLLDCDGDTILYIVNQTGVACHTGSFSCFFNTAWEREEEE